MPTIPEKRQAFRRLHEQGCFVMPNAWTVGTTRYLQHLGFGALATTSAGCAFDMGLPDTDGALSRDVMLAHVATIVEAADVPVNADFESGYAHAPEGVAESVRLCVTAGVAGLSIEDATGETARPLYDPSLAAARVRAARAAIDGTRADVVLTARAECFVVGRPDLEETIGRLRAYAAAGADCLFAPGIETREQIAAVVEAVAPKPVNVLVSSARGLDVGVLAGLGVRRISLGSALARTAWGGFVRAARAIAQEGKFEGLAGAVPFAELNVFFRDDLQGR
jgi:2-methylisocitrate lyase-like PEP mutase family enzyme